MQKLWWVSCALALVACGRIAQGTNDDVGSSTAGLDCTYGKIASVPGLPLSLASTGKSIFIVSYDVGGEIGDLRAVTSDGAVHLLARDNAAVGMIPTGSSLVFSRRTVDQQQNLLGETIDIVDENFAISQLDTTTDSIAKVDSLIGDGRGGVVWRRWAKGNSPDDPSVLGSVSLEKFTGGSVVTIAGNSDASWPNDIVTDGTDYYGLVAPQDPSAYGNVVGRIGIGTTPELILVGNTANQIRLFQSVVGVDDTNVVYLTYGTPGADAWAVPKNGGTPLEIAALATGGNAPVLYDHHLYWAQQNGDDTYSVSRVATAAGSVVEKIATQSASIAAITVDACGVVYAVTDSAAPGTTAATIYRSKI